jgi:hypothetical protein
MATTPIRNRQNRLRRGARWLVEGFRPAFLATAGGARLMAQTLAEVTCQEFANALRVVEAAEAKNGKNREA